MKLQYKIVDDSRIFGVKMTIWVFLQSFLSQNGRYLRL